MWRCGHCGAKNRSDLVCAACGRPIDEAFCKISLKIMEMSFLETIEDRWVRRGWKAGILVGLVLSPILMPMPPVSRLTPWQGLYVAPIFLMFTLGLIMVAVVFSSTFFLIVSLIFGAIKPILVALFCSTERFEQEYGSTKK